MSGRAVVAGHLCLDIIPLFEEPPAEPSELFSPGRLFQIGSTLFSTGGAVANTGGALLSLGVDSRLVARVGEDGFGATVRALLARAHPEALVDLRVGGQEGTSYSIIISSPRFDRIFFHYSGANDAFSSADIDASLWEGRDLLHFGYPPAMRRMYEEEGAELLRLLHGAKEAGLTTSLDLSYPQPGSRAAKADWRRILARVLPEVDLFLPSAGELAFMLRGCRGGEREASVELLRELADWVLSHGCPVCVLKIGSEGLYVRTTADERRLAVMGRGAPGAWEWGEKELLEPCFLVEAAGTTGAGDVTIAGFLAAVLRGLPLEEAATMGLAAGAASVEGVEAAAAVPGWEELARRVSRGWARRERRMSL